MDSVTANINKLISLTFDESPDVRKQAAKSLSEINDPAAVFALMELGFDKDPSVREVANQYLDKKKQTEPELMSFANIFSTDEEKSEQKEDEPAEAKEKMLRPITQIFEKRLGKEKAEVARSKLMPTIEKVYQKAHEQQGKKKNDESGRKVMQEFLTNYLEVMSDLDRIGDEPIPQVQSFPGTQSFPIKATHGPVTSLTPGSRDLSLPPESSSDPSDDTPLESGVSSSLSGELEEVGKSSQTDKLSSEIVSVETSEIEELKERAEIEHLPDTFFKKAYETMMFSGGDEETMRQEMNQMIEEARREIGLAFRMAKKRFKETKVTNITKIKDGTRNINTEVLTVKSMESIEYQKTKKQKGTTNRILVNDEHGNEGIVYLFDNRGSMLQTGMRIKVVGGLAKTFESSGETALTIGKKGSVYIIL